VAVWRDTILPDYNAVGSRVENNRPTEKKLFAVGRLDYDLDRGKPMATILMNYVTELVQILFIPCAVCALMSTSKGLGIRDDQLYPGQIIVASMVSPCLNLSKAVADRQRIVLHNIRPPLLHHTWPTKMQSLFDPSEVCDW
jgi:hypothetical protein